MPVYDYKCQTHGVFNELAKVEDYQKPMPCPSCNQLSPRVLCIPPELFKLDSHLHQAVERNEKACNAPLVSTKDQRENDSLHRQACGCTGNKAHKRSVLFTAQGEKMFPSARPWMVSH